MNNSEQRKMTKTMIFGALAALLAGVAIYITQTGPDRQTSKNQAGTPQGAAMVTVTLPETLSQTAQMGQRAFETACAECHGRNAAGKMGNGPPLIHKIYEPSHHGDMAFHLAVQNGVRAHHWKFGNMPAQDGLTRSDVNTIVAYVREVQQANGIN